LAREFSAFAVEKKFPIQRFEGAEKISKVPLDVGEVHFVQDKKERSGRVFLRGQEKIQDFGGLVDGDVGVFALGLGGTEIVDKPEDVPVIGPIRANGHKGESVFCGATQPLGEELGKFSFAGAGVAGKDNEGLSGKRADEVAEGGGSKDETGIVDGLLRA
jgi:hypothetical protein